MHARRISGIIIFLSIVSICSPAARPQDRIAEAVARESASLEKLYLEFHTNPELSYCEERTSARVAGELEKAGFEITRDFGKYNDPARKSHGVVGILRNGEGPVVLVRADMDALPVEEKTGLPYASAVKTTNDSGTQVSVMHACGHDMHMTALVGAARALAALRAHWKGTVILVAQPSEERAPGGAEAMLRAGLYDKFPKPDAAFALHCSSTLAAGKVGFVSGYALANADTVDITVRGAGGHGAYPQSCKDPIVLSSQMILAFQTIVSRETAPGEPAVITVGSIHGGSKHNIIPDEVKLQLTVRSYSSKTRETLLKGIERVAAGTAAAAGFPKELAPVVDLHPDEFVPSTFNHPDLVARTLPALREQFGAGNVVEQSPVLGAEDFGFYSLPNHDIPCFMLWLGAVPESKIKEYDAAGKPLPSLHSSQYAPAMHPTIETGARALCAAALSQLKK